MPRKRKKPKLTKILCLGLIIGTLYGYGAGRARISSVGIKHWNPLEIYNVWAARRFEKRLAKKIYGRKSFGNPRIRFDQGIISQSMLYNQIYGENGLAEFNGVKGIQAEEHVRAIEKIYDKKVNIREKDIQGYQGKDILNRLFWGTNLETLEKAVRKWNNTGPSIVPEKLNEKIDYGRVV